MTISRIGEGVAVSGAGGGATGARGDNTGARGENTGVRGDNTGIECSTRVTSFLLAYHISQAVGSPTVVS